MLKRSVVIRANHLRMKKNHYIDYKLLLFFTLLICGIILGSFISQKGSAPWHNYLITFFNNYFELKANSNIFIGASGVFVSFFIIILSIFLLGFSSVGLPFITIIPLLYGSYCGIISSQYFILYGLSGFGYFILINVVPYSIIGAVIIKCCSESSILSKKLFYYLLGSKENYDKEILLKDYSIKFLILLIPVVIAALTESVLFKLFCDLFKFIK